MLSPFDKFLIKFGKSFKGKNPVINGVMANVFSMRIIGNKTHGDLAEIALTEYINQFVAGYKAKHTGKEKFRAKKHEEDIEVTDKSTGDKIPISIKAYGSGPLQLSTNKESSMFSYLSKVIGKKALSDLEKISSILNSSCFSDLGKVNILPLIYNERKKSFKIIVFDLKKAYLSVSKIKYFPPRKLGKKKTFPIYKFFGKNNQYIFEVRYGDARANALQRGMWTHTENAKPFFDKILDGSYDINQFLIDLMSKILVSSKEKHKKILKMFK